MGDGTEKNPYTREDVLRLIKENGGTAKGLDLSGKRFEKGIDLKGLDLRRIILSHAFLSDAVLESAHLEGANLDEAWFSFANLAGAHLERAHLYEANLWNTNLAEAHLEKSSFRKADLQMADLNYAKIGGADFREAILAGADLTGVEFPRDTQLEEVDWGYYRLGGWREDVGLPWAEITYRRLKIWYTEHGFYDVAGEFFYQEKEAKRKGVDSRRRDRIAGWLSWAFFGHGERWRRLLFWIGGFILLFALIYLATGTLTLNNFLNSLYFSAVSFIALGYGSWVIKATGWVKGLGVLEAFLGFFMMTLLLVTFVRKMTR